MKEIKLSAADELVSMARIAACAERAARMECAMLMLRIAVQLDAGTRVADLAKGEQV